MMQFTRRELFALFAAAPWCGPRSAPLILKKCRPSASGITWKHDNAMSPKRWLPETIGPGCAFLDYDGDGWMDILLVNSGPCDFFKPEKPLHHALYKNNRDGTFTDVTAKAGITAELFGQGVAVGDFDNDGRTRHLHHRVWRPGAVPTTTATAPSPMSPRNPASRAPTGPPPPSGSTTTTTANSTCSSARSSQYSAKSISCGDNKLGRAYYCIPRVFNPTASVLYHNNGDGTFTEVSKGTDIAKALGKGLGVVATDVNNDGRMDLFVSNDTVQNFLFMNRGGGKWEETALAAEVGFSDNGQARSGMGVDAADMDGDGWQDLFVANVDQEMFSLYHNNHNESFSDVAHKNNIAQSTRLLSGWGLKFFDYDNDGNVDLILANGHPDDMIENYSQQVKYKEPLLLFHNDGGTMRNVSTEAGPAFTASLPGARTRHRRLQQRWTRRRPHWEQRRGARAAEEQSGRGQPLGGAGARRHDVQSRRRRCAHLLVGGRQGPLAIQTQRR